jgi:hypothetical protein
MTLRLLILALVSALPLLSGCGALGLPVSDDDDVTSVDDDDSAPPPDDDDSAPPLDDDDDDDDDPTFPEECPASSVVEFTDWNPDPWVAPLEGTAQQAFRFDADDDLHYSLLQLDFDFHTTTLEGPYTCFAELRNTGACHDCVWPWRYFALCTKNEPPLRTVLIIFAGEEGNDRVNDPFVVQPDTDYHMAMTFDAEASLATLVVTEVGGPSSTLEITPLTSSIAPQGQGLDLRMGFSITHPDYPDITPPWGWTFSNLVVSMTPGGPFGAAAPPCP